jgi:predicted DNA-binding protein with PD1-like motif
MGNFEVGEGRRVFARLPHGGDLIDEILAVANENRIELAQLWAIGAVQKARLAYYDQVAHEYREHGLNQPLEIASLIGNISLRDKAAAVHAHAVFADQDGRTYGGHVAPGCVIFACELLLVEFLGDQLVREHDEATGLPLWKGL